MTDPHPQRPSTASSSGPATDRDQGPAADTVRSLIEAGQLKRAVEAGKDLVRRAPGPQSEALLAEAYVARALSFEPGMAVEMVNLVAVASERCPSAQGLIDAARPRLSVRFGRVDEVVGALHDETAPAAVRGAIDDAFRRELVDLRALAQAESLPPSHPLRTAAAQIAAAFDAATSGPVRDDQIELPQVSRRSPLSAWKPLVRAIACFYRGDDEPCRAHLALVDGESAAAGLVPSLQALVAGKMGEADPVLARQVVGTATALRDALQDLDKALEGKKLSAILRAVRQAVQECRRTRPDLVESLRQRIVVKCFLLDSPRDRVLAALGGPVHCDASFHRLFAHALEKDRAAVGAAVEWDLFLSTSVQEGRFEERGAETAIVVSRILDLLDGIPAKELGSELAQAWALAAEMGAKLSSKSGDLHPRALYARLALLDPRRETFERWFNWALRNDGGPAAEAVASSWAAALPQDARPFLLTMELAEGRGAFKKALGFLARAEALERLNPDVARARFRLTFTAAWRHLREVRPHLLAKDVAALETLPDARDGRRPAFVAALRLFLAAMEGGELSAGTLWRVTGDVRASAGSEPTRVEQCRQDVSRLMGGEREGALLLRTIAYSAWPRVARLLLPSGTPAELAAALAAACWLCDSVGLQARFPPDWAADLLAGFHDEGAMDEGALAALAVAALRSEVPRLAYAATGPGLARRARPGRFLLLRARSIPEVPRRQTECLRAAAAIAQRERDTALLADVRAAMPYMPWFDLQQANMPLEEIDRVVKRERGSAEYPLRDVAAPAEESPCLCPECRARAEGLLPPEDLDDQEWDVDEDVGIDDLPPLPPALAGLPQNVLSLMLEMMAKYGDIDPDDLAERDPVLLARLERAMDEHLLKGGTLPGMGRRKRRPQSKRRRKKR